MVTRENATIYNGKEDGESGMPTIIPPGLTWEQERAYIVQLQMEDLTHKLCTGDLAAQSHKEMVALNPDFEPPADDKLPATCVSHKVVSPQDEYPEINFLGLLIGPNCDRGKWVCQGKAGSKDGQMLPREGEPRHALASANTMENKQAIETPADQNDLWKMQLQILRPWQSSETHNIAHTTVHTKCAQDKAWMDKESLSLRAELGEAPMDSTSGTTTTPLDKSWPYHGMHRGGPGRPGCGPHSLPHPLPSLTCRHAGHPMHMPVGSGVSCLLQGKDMMPPPSMGMMLPPPPLFLPPWQQQPPSPCLPNSSMASSSPLPWLQRYFPAEGEAGFMHREPDVGFDPGSPGSRPGPKAGAKPLCHPGIPVLKSLSVPLSARHPFTPTPHPPPLPPPLVHFPELGVFMFCLPF
ncbi:unnamed protein product [Nyctereutes procyonoides]|uniref:(raccoon dog) hypothetical protein n=1 Tax=Nyctereutes procyonoides TaxID=34880 RepID=A0A811YWV8_NYCPR|nr:unnamed protein product [Nyctereutes procyonoides]